VAEITVPSLKARECGGHQHEGGDEPDLDLSSTEELHFLGHGHYLVTVARACADSGQYTDVRLQCADGHLRAHSIVLASCSQFLKEALMTLPQGMNEFTLVLPGVRKQVANTLVEFLYTVNEPAWGFRSPFSLFP